MANKNIYPFRVYASYQHYVRQSQLAERLWLRDRAKVAKGMGWYALDLEVLGPTLVKIYVRDMLDSVYGGIGGVIFEYTPELAPADLLDLQGVIVERQWQYAAEEYRARQKYAENMAIEKVRKEMFGD